MDPTSFLKEYQTLVTGIITLMVLSLGLIFTYRQLIGIEKDRRLRLVMDLAIVWESSSILESRKAIFEIENSGESLHKKLKEYERSNPEKYLNLIKVGNFFENMGWLIDKRSIEDLDLIVDLFGNSITNYYEQYKEYISKEREEGNTQLYKYFEKLAKIVDVKSNK